MILFQNKMIKLAGSLFPILEKSLISNASIRMVQVAGLKFYYPKEEIDQSEWPENRKLRQVEKQPFSGKPRKMYKMIKLMRGPEPVHNKLIYQGYGVKALLGGRMKFEHFETVRFIVNKKIDVKRMFAIWRIDDPWQPLSKRSAGKTLGGGKGVAHHYCTPVKADRMIVELCGDISDLEAKKILSPVAEILPFPARVVSQKDLENEIKHEEWIQKNNINPYTMEYVIKNNMGGCQKMISKYDYRWLGKYK